jgi:hypothetical protein
MNDIAVNNAAISKTMCVRKLANIQQLNTNLLETSILDVDQLNVINHDNVIYTEYPLSGDGTSENPVAIDPSIKYYEWFGQNALFADASTTPYWDAFGINTFGGTTWRFVPLNNLSAMEISAVKLGAANMGDLRIDVCDSAGILIPGIATPLNITANGSAGIMTYTFTTPLLSGTAFTMSVTNTIVGSPTAIRMFARGVINN